MEPELSLDEQVEARKAQERAGLTLPKTSFEERRAERLAMDGIVSVADCIRETLPRFAEIQAKLDVFIKENGELIAMSDPIFCIEHEDVQLPVDFERTNGQSWKQQRLVMVYGECPKCQEEKRASDIVSRWLSIGIPHKVAHATFENFYSGGDVAKEKALKKFKAQSIKGGFIIAVGKVGTGKSHLAAATIKQVGGGIFVTQHDMIGELRATYSNEGTQDELVEKYRKAKVFVLDELTPEVKGVDISPFLYRVLAQRYDEDKLTVLTSNEEVETCLAILGPKLRDRIRTNYTLANFTWESHRKPS